MYAGCHQFLCEDSVKKHRENTYLGHGAIQFWIMELMIAQRKACGMATLREAAPSKIPVGVRLERVCVPLLLLLTERLRQRRR